jgi:hypothetical protein
MNDAQKDQFAVGQLEKLRLEIDSLKSKNRWENSFGRFLPIITATIAVAGFWFGIIQYQRQETARATALTAQIKSENEARVKEFKKSFWEKQLGFYLEAARTSATLANFQAEEKAETQAERGKARIRFWQLYWGELAVVEDDLVAAAMITFANCLRGNESGTCSDATLKSYSLDLAVAFRKSVEKAWDLTPAIIEKPK